MSIETLSRTGSITEHIRQGHAFLVAPAGSTQKNWLNALFPHTEQLTSLQAAHDAMVDGRGDVAYVADGEYDETLAVTKSGLSFRALSQGVLPRAIVKPTTLNAKAITVAVAVRKVDFIGIGTEPNLAAANSGVDVMGSDIDFIGCKFAGDDGDAVKIGGGATDAAARVRITDSEFEWADRHLVFKVATGSGNLNTEIEVTRCIFHDAVTRCVARLDPAGSVQGSYLRDCDFLQNEDGSQPTKYLELDGASELNSFHRLSFATADAASAKMLVTAGSKWVGCLTEAGLSVAHPS